MRAEHYLFRLLYKLILVAKLTYLYFFWWLLVTFFSAYANHDAIRSNMRCFSPFA
jgi:hypothetical protein